MDDFAKLDLRVGKIIKCEEKEGSEKLLRLTVDFGTDGARNILSGIKQWYKPEDLLNKQYIFVFNLLPRTMMGEDSEGMLLAADGGNSELPEGGKPLPLTVIESTTPGAKIR